MPFTQLEQGLFGDEEMNMGKSLSDKVKYLIENNIGDKGRLESIQNSIHKGKLLYHSDQKYLDSIITRHFPKETEPETISQLGIKENKTEEISARLLDQNIEAYVINGKDKSKTLIQDDKKNTLAIIKDGETLVLPNGKILIKIRNKSTFNQDMIMEDSEKKIIGVIKHQEIETFALRDKNKDILLIGTAIPSKSPHCEITDKNQNLIASFSMMATGNKRQRWFGDWYDQYILHIHDMSFSRIILLGFFTCVHYEFIRSTDADYFLP